MNIIEQKDNEFIKYMIQLNEEELKKIRQEVIAKCGEITHYCYESEKKPDLTKFHCVKNFKQTFVREYEFDYFYSWGKRSIFRYEYDSYGPTPLTTLIDRLFEGDSSAILELKNPQPGDTIQDQLQAQLQEKKEQIMALLSASINTDINQLDQLKNELNSLQEKQKLNRSRSSDLEYYPQVLSCIQMIEVMRINEDRVVTINALLEEAYQSIAEIQPFFEDGEKKKMTIDAYQKTIGKLVD